MQEPSTIGLRASATATLHNESGAPRQLPHLDGHDEVRRVIVMVVAI
ncbi:hypothetical protein [Nocardioides sp.]|nr:hypothetical protein [Nocardioides sp.]HXH81063.1 hypothetical protein [Nocardioides sp.]